MIFMGDYIRGVVVKLHLTPKQEVIFKQNYGCTRKTHNELLNKYKAKYGDSNKIPTKKELNQFLTNPKKNYTIYTKQSPQVFNRHGMICIKRLKTVLKAKGIILQNFTLKRKHDPASDKQSEKTKNQ